MENQSSNTNKAMLTVTVTERQSQGPWLGCSMSGDLTSSIIGAVLAARAGDAVRSKVAVSGPSRSRVHEDCCSRLRLYGLVGVGRTEIL